MFCVYVVNVFLTVVQLTFRFLLANAQEFCRSSRIQHTRDEMAPRIPRSLSIAFFGSDQFSVASLDRLRRLRAAQPHLIDNLDVYARSIKPTGRKHLLVDLPIGDYAQSHGLPIHRVDTAEEIIKATSPRNYHMAIAVSYGKLIPAQLLTSLPFGGLNVHPSKLPRFSGSSPIQHALMSDCKSTAVTVQTLHPTKFDHGDIIAQTGDIEIVDNDNFATLQSKLAGAGADLLAEVICSGSYADFVPIKSSESFSLAPKLSPVMSEVNWTTMTSRQIRRLADALGALHTYKHVNISKKKKSIDAYFKVILDDIVELPSSDLFTTASAPGDFAFSDNSVVVKTIDAFISIERLKFQYCGLEDANTFMRNLKKRAGSTANTFITSRSFPCT